MGWWGKIIGGAFGFMLGGPLGALLGAVLGHNLDKGMRASLENERMKPGDQERVQTAFFTATFSVMGHISKADGRVSEDEISVARQVMDEMDLTPQMRRVAIRLFNEGKRDGFSLDDVVEQFRIECYRRQTLIQMFLEIQLQAAYADGKLDAAEERLLLRTCAKLHFSVATFRQLERMIRAQQRYTRAGERKRPAPRSGPSLNDAYDILGISRDSSDAEIKQAYRRLLSQHHPDKLVSKGLPEEMMKMAAKKTHEIRQAYEQIKESRGF